MLNKENKKIIKLLNGEYKNFAIAIKKELFSRCSPSSKINDSLTDLYQMLYESQSSQKDFEEVIPNPKEMIKETILCFEPKGLKNVIFSSLTTLLFCIVAVLIYIAIPVQLKQVENIQYNEYNNYISWSKIDNATRYIVSIDGKEFETYDNIIKVDNDLRGIIEVKVQAKSSDKHYKDSKMASSSVNIKNHIETISIAKLFKEVCLSNAHKISDQGFGRSIRCEVNNYLFDYVIFEFVPEFNFYARFCAFDKVRGISVDDKKVDLAEEMWFIKDKKYSVEIKESIIQHQFIFELQFADLNKTRLSIPQGICIFDRIFECSTEKKAYAYKCDGLLFSEIDLNEFGTPLAWYDSFIFAMNEQPLAIKNDSNESIDLNFVQKQMNYQENMSFKKGYTKIIVDQEIKDKKYYLQFLSDEKFTLYIFKNNGSSYIDYTKLFEGEDDVQSNFIDKEVYLFSTEYEVILFTEKNLDLNIKTVLHETDYSHNNNPINHDTKTITLSPGITFFRTEYNYIYELYYDKFFAMYQPINNIIIQYPDSISDGHLRYMIFCNRYFDNNTIALFNPGDEDIIVNVNCFSKVS